MRRATILFLFLILIGAALIRLYNVRDLSTFLADQAIELSSSRAILQGKFTLIGIKTSNSELHNGAVMYYPLAAMLWIFSGDPIAGSLLQILMQLIGFVIVFLIGKQFFSLRIAVITTMMLATNAVLVRFSRQTMLAYYPFLFTVTAMWLALQIRRQVRSKESFLLGMVIGIAVQVHYSMLSLAIFALGYPLLFRLPDLKRYYSGLIVGAVVGFSPMIAFEIRHQFFNTRMLAQLLTHPSGSGGSFFFFTYWRDVLATLVLGEATPRGWVLAVLIAAGLALIRKSLTAAHGICLWLIAANILFSRLFVREPVIHYAIASYAALFFLIATLISDSVRLWGRWQRVLISTLLVVGYIFLQVRFYGWGDDHGWMMTAGWTETGTERAARIIRADHGNQSLNVTMLIDGQSEGVPLRYFLDGWSIPVGGTADYDKVDLLYVVIKPGMELRGINPYEVSAFGAYDIDRTWDIQHGIRLYRLSHHVSMLDKQAPSTIR